MKTYDIVIIGGGPAGLAAAVSAKNNGIDGLFIRAIPYNFYALFTIAMMVMLVVLRVDYGPMAKSEALAGGGRCV